MLDFLCKAKQIKLSTGRDVTILRPGLGYYFHLSASILELKSVEIKQQEDIEEYIKWLSENPEKAARYTIYYKQIMHYLKHFILDGIPKDLNKKEEMEILKEAQEFNSIKKSGGTPIQSVEQLNKALNDIIAYLIAHAHYDIEYICESVDIVQANILIDNINRSRITQIYDMIAAIGGAMAGKDKKSINSFDKYIANIQGLKRGSLEDAIRETLKAADNG